MPCSLDSNTRKSAMRRQNHTGTRGFTLVELLVVISIIALLIGLGAAGMGAFAESNERNRTRQILDALNGALEEYNASTGTYGPDPDPTGSPDDYTADEFLEAAYDNCRPAYEIAAKSIDADFMYDDDGDGENIREYVVDAWGQQIRYVIVGDPGSGFPQRNQPYFCSPGPDKEWGEIDSNNEPDAEAKDNLYSFDL